jgi:hypothetical protein
MSITEPKPAAPKLDRQRFQYSIAELLAVTTIVAVGLSVLKWLEIEFGLDIVAFAIVGSLYVGCATWLFIDARKRGYPGVMVVLLFTLFCPFAVIVWIFIRPKAKVVIRPPAEYANPDDALAAAFQLDMDGDWDAAIVLYAEAARRWPEHEQYARGCITQVEEKRSRVEQP